MTRKLRNWYPGAVYHIMHRGIRRMEIYSCDEDYQIFLSCLKAEIERYGCSVHAYCLMTNHFHLLLQTSGIEIWKLMKNLSHKYAQYYNSRHGYRGHLFENRYVSCMVEDDTYFLQTSRYIHLNPVKARMVRNPDDYYWSSFRTVVGIDDDRITECDRTLSFFTEPKCVKYRNFVEDKGHRYAVTEHEIHMRVEKEEIWLPWD